MSSSYEETYLRFPPVWMRLLNDDPTTARTRCIEVLGFLLYSSRPSWRRRGVAEICYAIELIPVSGIGGMKPEELPGRLPESLGYVSALEELGTEWVQGCSSSVSRRGQDVQALPGLGCPRFD